MQGQAFDATTYKEAAYKLSLQGQTLEGRFVNMRELFAVGSLIYKTMASLKPFERDSIANTKEKLAYEVLPMATTSTTQS